MKKVVKGAKHQTRPSASYYYNGMGVPVGHQVSYRPRKGGKMILHSLQLRKNGTPYWRAEEKLPTLKRSKRRNTRKRSSRRSTRARRRSTRRRRGTRRRSTRRRSTRKRSSRRSTRRPRKNIKGLMDKEEQDYMQFLDDDDVVNIGSEAWLEGSDEDDLEEDPPEPSRPRRRILLYPPPGASPPPSQHVPHPPNQKDPRLKLLKSRR